MGTISKRTDNKGPATWQARIRRRGLPELSASFPSQAEADAWVRKVESEFNANKLMLAAEAARVKLARSFTDPAHLPLGYLIDRYIKEVSPTKKGAATEIIRLRAMKKTALATYKLAQITPQVLAAWRDERLKSVSGSTVNRDLNLIGHLIEIARMEWGAKLNLNPVRCIRRPKANPARVRRLSHTEELAILEACSKARAQYLRPAVELALETAMRQSEIVGLDWKWIDLKKRTIHLHDSKNGEGRGIPLSTKAVKVLESLPVQVDDHGNRIGPVFHHLTTEAIKRAFIRVCERAGVDDFHFHDLRHEATSRFFEKGLNIMEVASITGHKSLSMLRRYTHLDAGKLASRLD